MSDKKGLSLLIALGKKKGEGEMGADDDAAPESEKSEMAADVMSAMKDDDKEAFAMALEDFVKHCMKEYE